MALTNSQSTLKSRPALLSSPKLVRKVPTGEKMQKLLKSAALLALTVSKPTYAATYLMDWSADGTAHRYVGGVRGYSEDITVTERGQGSFTIDESKLGGSFHDYLTSFSLISHVVELDHETAPGFDFTLPFGETVTFGMPLFFSFTPASAGQPALLSFATGDIGPPGVFTESITGFNNVFSGMVTPLDVATVGTLTFTQAAAVPEPLSWTLMLVGFGVIGTAVRRRSYDYRARHYSLASA